MAAKKTGTKKGKGKAKTKAPVRRLKKKNSKLKPELISIAVISFSLLILISVYTVNGVGSFGKFVQSVFRGTFGLGAYILPLIMMGFCFYILFSDEKIVRFSEIVYSAILFICIIVLAHILNVNQQAEYSSLWQYINSNYISGDIKNGGLLGAILGNSLLKVFGIGAYLVVFVSMLISIILFTGKSFFETVHNIFEFLQEKFSPIYEEAGDEYYDEYEEEFEEYEENEVINHKQDNKIAKSPPVKEYNHVIAKKDNKTSKKIDLVSEKLNQYQFDDLPIFKFKKPEELNSLKKVVAFEVKPKPMQKQQDKKEEIGESSTKIVNTPNECINVIDMLEENKIDKIDEINNEDEEEFYIRTMEEEHDEFSNIEKPVPSEIYEFPSILLLKGNPIQASAHSKAHILENSKKLEVTLKSFGVEAKVVEVNIGPAVTRYELSPGQGVKVSKISGLSDDLALNLAATGIRIEAPIPGKSVVGIEVPNKEVTPVYLKEVLEDDIFKKFPSKLAFGLGKDIAGNTVVADIAKMPHMLIAGATGSGKSVCINTLVTSIIYKAKPEEVKLLMIDPKVVELSIYNGIPHLLIPVVTDPKKAAGALNWAVREMTIRYDLFAENSVRDLKGYNTSKEEMGEEDLLPQIVIIIDELADLMMTAAKEVEDAICRLAQMARAAGLHLIIATQRPSVDVITGLIKANIPSRLAFSVSSGTDSRTILDMTGAEKLLGKGDMLFYPVGFNKPLRVQGAFISDKEVESIVNFVKKGKAYEYDEIMIEKITSSSKTDEISNEDTDEFLEEAIAFIVRKQKASASLLQRQFRIGYNRASRLIEELENRGIIGPDEGSKPRKVLMTKYEWENYRENREKN